MPTEVTYFITFYKSMSFFMSQLTALYTTYMYSSRIKSLEPILG